ncbi:MAG: S8 family serine peptidase [Gemmataceae bacterium]|nr:S8 family serine peptidase [Gemmataceae bacterium]
MRSHNSRRRLGFTLIELLVVVAIIGILVSLSFFMFSYAEQRVAAVNSQVAGAHARMKKFEEEGIIKKRRPTYFEDRFIVRFKFEVRNPAAEAARLAADLGGEVLHIYDRPINGCALKIPADRKKALLADAAVARLEHDAMAYALAETTPTGMGRMGVPYPPTRSRNGLPLPPPFSNQGTEFVDIAIMDTGVDNTHPDLNVIFNKGFGLADIGDPNGHGTHVAGTAAARMNDFGVVGVAPGARIWNLRVLDANGSGPFSQVIAATMFVAANSNQIKVCNMSLGGPYNQTLIDAVELCVAKGVVMVVAAGNSSDDASQYSPAAAPSAITVAALADSDGRPGGTGGKTSAGNDDTFADFSSFGAVVDVIAPGVDILSSWPGTFNTISGTSMSSPHVAGLAVLIRCDSMTLIGFPSRPRPGQGIGNIIIGPIFPTPKIGSHLTPDQVLTIILGTSVENIPGRFDSRLYPLVNARLLKF